jgi:hypothetical protein
LELPDMDKRHADRVGWLSCLTLLGALLLAAGCNALAPPAASSDRAFREAVKKDPFPTAAQAGIASSAVSKKQ